MIRKANNGYPVWDWPGSTNWIRIPFLTTADPLAPWQMKIVDQMMIFLGNKPILFKEKEHD